MRILSLTHSDIDPAGIFGNVVRERGHELDDRSLPLEDLPDDLERYGAVMVFGGTMHTHEEEDHPWLREEKQLLRGALERGTPVFGVCLGGQLLAAAAGAAVSELAVPEIGWYDVELLPEARDDPVFAGLPRRFTAYQWHRYRFDLPGAAVPLARNETCLQAFRLDGSWGVQFHPEVEPDVLETWIAYYDTDEQARRLGRVAVRGREETRRHVGRWNEIGRTLAARFVEFAERRR